jgi:hypothetical protein
LVNYGYFPGNFGPVDAPNMKHFNELASYCRDCVSNSKNIEKVSDFKRYEDLGKRFNLKPDPDTLVIIFHKVIEEDYCTAYLYFHKRILVWFAENEKEVIFGHVSNDSAIKEPEYVKIKEIVTKIFQNPGFTYLCISLRTWDDFLGEKNDRGAGIGSRRT